MTGMPWVTPPPPRVHAVSLGPDGLLWVLVRRAHRNWAENKKKAGSIPRGPVSPRQLGVRISALFEGVLDVFDPASGTLLASRDVSGGVIGFARPGVLTEILEHETGAISIQLWDITVKR